jgi:hypothetical protein
VNIAAMMMQKLPREKSFKSKFRDTFDAPLRIEKSSSQKLKRVGHKCSALCKWHAGTLYEAAAYFNGWNSK